MTDMITINPLSQVEMPYIHMVSCKKDIGSFKKGKNYKCKIIQCKGKIYEPGFKIVKDRKIWNDKIGKPDTRLMMSEATFKDGAYACASLEELNKAFVEEV